MANPLINRSSEVSGSVNVPVLSPPPKLASFLYLGLGKGAEAYDKAMLEWVERNNDGLTKVLKSLKDNTP